MSADESSEFFEKLLDLAEGMSARDIILAMHYATAIIAHDIGLADDELIDSFRKALEHENRNRKAKHVGAS